MGMLDFLISEDNVEPKPNMEYIYLFNMVWLPNELGSIEYERGSIVTDVVKLPNRSFEFTDKITGVRYRTNYGWSLAENTPENLNAINIYDIEAAKLKRFENTVKKLRRKIKTLEEKK